MNNSLKGNTLSNGFIYADIVAQKYKYMLALHEVEAETKALKMSQRLETLPKSLDPGLGLQNFTRRKRKNHQKDETGKVI